MFREMRRNNQALCDAECVDILCRQTSGVLAVFGDCGYPYAVPLSYAFDGAKLYFHCAKDGHKLDAIRQNDKVSFCVTSQDDIVPEAFTTRFKSVIAFGRARIVEDENLMRKALSLLADKYSPDFKESSQLEIDRLIAKVCIIELTIEHLTGKEAIELTRERNAK